MTQQRRTIEEFGIVRREEESHYLYEYTYLVPFAGPMTQDTEWTSRQIHHPNNTDPWGLHQYAINNVKKVYVLFSAFLLSVRKEEGRKTRMRLWQMIVANWIDAGNPPGSLRYLGVSMITNIEVRELLALEWQHQIDRGQQSFGTLHQRMLTVTRGNSSNTWSHNTFVRSGLRVAESLSSAKETLTLDKVHLIRIPEPEGGFVLWNLVLEFKSGDAERGNYREKLIRRLLPMITQSLEDKEEERQVACK
ncbi:hypothetical protein N0V93_002623 [Gnomoniopsis smithogilvyi]|uniref:Uncharacterized protein n=1 Tax=Gnomoniopsis smithogilvyi TaxID=1191159 RepID=A0A9W8YX19_9PEZI|nr:hypothetical protein N0V93_002623 [Gnomoniopsis smithogilvyi]